MRAKQCSKCQKEIKPSESIKYFGMCRICRNEYHVELRKKYPEQYKENVQRFRNKSGVRMCLSCKKSLPIKDFAPRQKSCIKCLNERPIKPLPKPKRVHKIRESVLKSDVKVIMSNSHRHQNNKAETKIEPIKDFLHPQKKEVEYQRVKAKNGTKLVRKGWDKIMNEIKLKCQIV